MHCAIHLLVDFSLRMVHRAGLGTRFSAWPHHVQQGHHFFNEYAVNFPNQVMALFCETQLRYALIRDEFEIVNAEVYRVQAEIDRLVWIRQRAPMACFEARVYAR